jgi:hypothetical protein
MLAVAVSAALFVSTCIVWWKSHDTLGVAVVGWAEKVSDEPRAGWGGDGGHAVNGIYWDASSQRGTVTIERMHFWLYDERLIDQYRRFGNDGGFYTVDHTDELPPPTGLPAFAAEVVKPGPTSQPFSISIDGYRVRFPHWIAACAFAVVPAVVTRRALVRRRRARAGRCVHCGYDLRASGAVCPECGKAVPSAAAPATWTSSP